MTAATSPASPATDPGTGPEPIGGRIAVTSYLKNGLIAGLIGGLAAALFMVTVGRGPINDAIALENSAATEVGVDADDAHEHDGQVGAGHIHEELFSRGVQEIGGAIGLLVYGVGIGLIFAVVLGATGPMLGTRSPFGASLRLGALGFWSVVVIPFLKLPANPPAVGNPDTIDQRTILYFAILAASIALTVFVAQLIHRSTRGSVATGWIAAAVYTVGLVILFAVLPDTPDAVTAPADLIWRFRLSSLGALASLWAAVTLVMGTLMERQARIDQGQIAGAAEPAAR